MVIYEKRLLKFSWKIVIHNIKLDMRNLPISNIFL